MRNSDYSSSRTLESNIKRFYNHLRRFTPEAHAPKLFYKISQLENQQQENIEYLVGSDLAAGLPLSGTLVDRAVQFLKHRSALFGFSRDQLDPQLFLKHTLYSQMGTHCIFGFRYKGREKAETSVTLHLDQAGHIVMFQGVYQTGMSWDDIKLDPNKISSTLADIEQGKYRIEKGKLKKFSEAKWVPNQIKVAEQWYPDWKEKYYRLCLQVKYLTPFHNHVFIVGGQGEIIRHYLVDAKAFLRIAKVYQNDWSLGETELESKFKQLKQVILRDITSDHELIGRYVAVKDNIMADKRLVDWDKLRTEPFRLDSSLPDRVIAYYHIDLIQRYFRELGLNILDDYPSLNPIQVILDNEIVESKFLPDEQSIHFRRLANIKKCLATDARCARIAYHEFVHAVTDALARLRRNDEVDPENPRLTHIIQAQSMDEGFADYFACSLAARLDNCEPFIGPMTFNKSKLAIDSCPRDLKGDLLKLPELGHNNGQQPFDFENIDTQIIYNWGEVWGRFLWHLREELGLEVADTIIAHSLFFLTRWATFGLGVMALLLADQLLFGGIHGEKILAKGKEVKDWKVLNES